MEEKLKQKPSDLVKVVLFGPESTGKTTMSKELAKHYKTNWVPEYARTYLQDKWDREKKVCTAEDLKPIAEGQIQLENEFTLISERLLICDTDLLETKVYSEAYYLGYCDPAISKYALSNFYDLYLLTSIDIPWEKDDLRDKPNERQKMFDCFKKVLEVNSKSFVILEGDSERRREIAINAIDKILEKK